MASQNQFFRLPDGRVLHYDVYGPPSGQPLFYFHGTPSARVEWQLFGSEELLHRLNLCVIAADRPGLGGSTFQPGRQVTDWPQDVVALADHLGCTRFAALGYSGGAPYAAACAALLSERLTRVGIVSGAAPFDVPGLAEGIHPDSWRFMELARDKPRLSRLMTWMMGKMARFAPQRLVTSALAALPEPDQKVVQQAAVQEGFVRMVQEATRQGPRGAQWDTYLMISPWSFALSEIDVPVLLWHGEEDRNAPVAMGRYLASHIPTCQATFFPGEGHLSVFATKVETILAAMVEQSSTLAPSRTPPFTVP